MGNTIRYFGDYELLEKIAQGGVGVVYVARQISLGRSVALKMLLSGPFAEPAELQRFRAEAEAVANLDHPHIVPLYEVGGHEGRSYYTMKLVRGGTLADRAVTFRDDPRAAARLVATVARAVHFAHEHGVLHRDLKPSNILLDEAGTPYVSDFGLAKRSGANPGLTQPTAVLGTPAYMAPEQAAGRTRDVTTAADVYSLGAVLYELLTGRRAFEAPSVAETLRLARDSEPASFRSLDARADRDLETICRKCLRKDPADRYRSADALAADLDRWLAGRPIVARPVGRAERAWRWYRRNAVVATLAGAVAVLVVAVAIGGTLAAFRFSRAAEREGNLAREAGDARDRSVENERRAVASDRTARRRLAESLVVGGDNLAKSRQFARARRSYTEAWDVRAPSDCRRPRPWPGCWR